MLTLWLFCVSLFIFAHGDACRIIRESLRLILSSRLCVCFTLCVRLRCGVRVFSGGGGGRWFVLWLATSSFRATFTGATTHGEEERKEGEKGRKEESEMKG